MTATPSLPSITHEQMLAVSAALPEGVMWGDQLTPYVALAAYQAGRDAGLVEAAKSPREYAEQLDAAGWGNRFPDELTAIFNASTNMASRIRALKSDAKEVTNG